MRLDRGSHVVVADVDGAAAEAAATARGTASAATVDVRHGVLRCAAKQRRAACTRRD